MARYAEGDRGEFQKERLKFSSNESTIASDSQAARIRSALFTICSSDVSLTLAPKLSHTRSSRRFASAAEKPNVFKASTRSRNLVDDLTSGSTVTLGSTAVDVAAVDVASDVTTRPSGKTVGTEFNSFKLDQKSVDFSPAATVHATPSTGLPWTVKCPACRSA